MVPLQVAIICLCTVAGCYFLGKLLAVELPLSSLWSTRYNLLNKETTKHHQ